MAVEFEVI